MNSKNIYQYIKTNEIKFHEIEKRKLNFKKKYEIRNLSKIQIIKTNTLFQNLIKRSNDMIYWKKKMIAYLLNMKKKIKNEIQISTIKKNVWIKLIFWKKISISELTFSVFSNKKKSFFLFNFSKFKVKKSKFNTKKWHNDKLILI